MLSHHPGFAMGAAVAVILSFGLMLAQQQAADERRVASRVDPTADQAFVVTYPVDGSIVTDRTLTVYGRALPGSLVQLGSRKIRADREGKWSVPVTLRRGDNRLAFLTRDKRGELIMRPITVHY